MSAAGGHLPQRVTRGVGFMIFASTFAAVVTAVAAVLTAIPPFAEYLRSCQARRGRDCKHGTRMGGVIAPSGCPSPEVPWRLLSLVSRQPSERYCP
jgi:hypothetical protein